MESSLPQLAQSADLDIEIRPSSLRRGVLPCLEPLWSFPRQRANQIGDNFYALLVRISKLVTAEHLGQ